MSLSGAVRQTGQVLAAAGEPQVEGVAAQPVSPFQLVGGDHPAGCAHVRVVSAVAAQRRGFPLGRGIDQSEETFRFWWNRFGPMFAGEVLESYVTEARDKKAALTGQDHDRRLEIVPGPP